MEKRCRPIHSGYETLRVLERVARRTHNYAGKAGIANEQMTASGYAVRCRPDFLDAGCRNR